MPNIIAIIRNFIRDERGQDIIEYGLLAALIAIVAASLLVLFNGPITNFYQRVLDALNTTSNSVNGT